MTTEIQAYRKKTIFYFTCLGSAYLVILGIVNMHLSKYIICVLDFSIAGILILNLLTLVRRNKIKIAATVILILLLLFYSYLFIEGGIKNTGYVWLFTYPMAAFFFKGKNGGVGWVVFFFSIIMLSFILSKIGLIALSQGDYFFLIFFFAFLLITAFVYLYENIRTESEEVVLTKNNTLETLNRELEYLSTHDPLTGIYNRRFIMKSLEDELNRSRRYDNIFSVLLIDIDHFKLINDRYGHQAGDMVISGVVRIFLDHHLREVDIFGRYGGDEFLIILPSTDHNGSRIVGEKLCESVKNKQFIDPLSHEYIPVSLSIGISTIATYKERDRILFEADTALYKSKADGRDRVTVYSPEFHPGNEAISSVLL